MAVRIVQIDSLIYFVEYADISDEGAFLGCIHTLYKEIESWCGENARRRVVQVWGPGSTHDRFFALEFTAEDDALAFKLTWV